MRLRHTVHSSSRKNSLSLSKFCSPAYAWLNNTYAIAQGKVLRMQSSSKGHFFGKAPFPLHERLDEGRGPLIIPPLNELRMACIQRRINHIVVKHIGVNTKLNEVSYVELVIETNKSGTSSDLKIIIH